MLFILAQICGALILLFEILTLLNNSKKRILAYNTLVNFLSLLQYLFLEALTGAFAISLTFVRNYIFNKYNKKQKKTPLYWLIIIMGLLIFFNIKTYDGIVSLIPIFTVGLYTFALWQDNVDKFKLLCMFTCFLSAIYNFHYGAYVSVLTQFILIIVCAGSYTMNKINEEKKKRRKRKKRG